MKIISLMEDTPGCSGCLHEHGLSFYIETKKHRLLSDTGATGAFLDNAGRLGVDLKEVDTVILSHGHYDHTGGMLAFAEKNPSARIYLHTLADGAYYKATMSLRRTIPLRSGPRKLLLWMRKALIYEGFRYNGTWGQGTGCKESMQAEL